MNDWGWNPSSVQAAGTFVAIVVLVFLIISIVISAIQTKASIRASKVTERESRLRTRPWLTLHDLSFEGDDLRLIFSNIGVLPAFEPVSRVHAVLSSDESVEEILGGLESNKPESGEEPMVIFPTGSSTARDHTARVMIGNFGARIRQIRSTGSVRIYGRVWYHSEDDHRYHTSFAFDADIESDDFAVSSVVEFDAI